MRTKENTLTRRLLMTGALSSLWYILINLYVPQQYEGYRLSSFTVSELSAIGAPTRQLWVWLAMPYTILFAFFGWGVVRQGKASRALRITGILILIYAAFNIYWPPMHMRGVEPTLTDALHIAWAMATVLFMIAIMITGAVSLDVPFRIITGIAIAMHIVFGLLTSLEAPQIPTNGPTPTIGTLERINIAVFMIWVVLFALRLLRRQKESNGGTEYLYLN